VILTPSWAYHDHGHEGSAADDLAGRTRPAGVSILPRQLRAAILRRTVSLGTGAGRFAPQVHLGGDAGTLDADPGPYAYADYVHRHTGAPVSRVIGAAAERLAGRCSSPTRRETAGVVYHVYEGRGLTRIGGEVLEWQRAIRSAFRPGRRIATKLCAIPISSVSTTGRSSTRSARTARSTTARE